ncbi:peptidase S41 [Sphingobacterium olei]|uniref:Peptidase S41 n=1 Tax=Sphingobacterium olei TaxID=2571155 RepID=A0A4U0NI83_9SPHI|nr:S41 family peptidase [Sphingobacterium olei]TJZ53713.1 peptidase S41 [Sphingobacterium olei]
MNFRTVHYGVLLVFCVCTMASCRKDDPNFPVGSDGAVNTWIREQMEQYYYWSSSLPSRRKIDFAPTAYFQSLLVKEDRFSAIMQSRQAETYGNTLLNTFGIDFLQVERPTGSVSLLSHIVPGSEGAKLALQRGDTVHSINGTPLRTADLPVLTQQALKNPSLALTLVDGSTYTLPASYISQPVVYPYHNFLLDADQKIAYLFLSTFDFSGAYELLKVVDDMRSSGVRDLILDLRYNSGGSVAFAAFTALALADVSPTDIFVNYKGNRHLNQLQETFGETLGRQPDGYSFSGSAVRESGLGLSRIVVLGTGHTASAAEMLINNLKPYISVIHIGEGTYGKDMASTTLTSPASVIGSEASWHILPMVYKIYNANNEGEYSKGLLPQRSVVEYATLPLYPFGDKRDALIADALTFLGSKRTLRLQRMSDLPAALPAAATLQFQSAPYEAKPIEIDFKN